MAQTFLRIISKRDMTLKEKVKACSIGSVSEKKYSYTCKIIIVESEVFYMHRSGENIQKMVTLKIVQGSP